jgi:hypothetical protein
VITFERQDDAERVLDALPKRFAKYGLTLHPDKTRLIEFLPPPRSNSGGKGGTFDLLGFTHFWGKTRQGAWRVQQKTAGDRLRRALRRIGQWCREHRHDPLASQQHVLTLMLRGHYGYYGRRGNSRALASFFHWTKRTWRKWLDRRSRSQPMTWVRFVRLYERYPLPLPRLPAWAWERAAKL